MATREEQLKNILGLLQSSATKEDVADLLKRLLTFLQGFKKQNETEWAMINSAFQTFKEQIKQETANFKIDEANKRIDETHKKHLDLITKKLSQVKDGKAGRDAVVDYEKLASAIAPKIKTPKDGEGPTDEKILSLIKPLIPEAEKIPKMVQTPAKVYRTVLVDVSSQCDGNNKTFVIGTNTHFGIIGVYGSFAPFHFRPIIDYTEAKNGITLTSEVVAPAAGQTLVIQFLK